MNPLNYVLVYVGEGLFLFHCLLLYLYPPPLRKPSPSLSFWSILS